MYLHLELTSKCALKCHICPRTQHKGKYKETEMKLEALKKILSSQQSFSSILLCGNHGDPIYHTRFHEALELIKRAYPEKSIAIATNGSFRNAQWWKKTSQILGPKDTVTFGIDGLKNTTAIYRKGSNWESIMLGIKTLRQQGTCKIHWQWILFGYNQDQVKEGMNLAKSLGVDKFELRNSFRQEINPLYIPTKSLDEVKKEINYEN